jgi:2-polyprenyl-6-methoxyphenol hydroxylase-like FAD-dependent oxidoreductase
MKTDCVIAGGGPAGMMMGFLLARAGVDVVVLEKHADFLRDFRGDTIHPSTLDVMHELGLLDEFLRRPHDELHEVAVRVGREQAKIADFRHVPTHCKFLMMMPQWDFLDFLAEHARRLPNFHLVMQAEARLLISEDGRVTGLVAKTATTTWRCAPRWWWAPTAAAPRSAPRPVCSRRTSALRWTCCGCASPACPAIRPTCSARSTPAACW